MGRMLTVSAFLWRNCPTENHCKLVFLWGIIIGRKQRLGGYLVERERYMISDAAAIVNVEAHVLRYWEEELELDIPRNEMGHRYYTKENLAQFLKIKELKEKGYQLKAIKMLVQSPETMNAVVSEESAQRGVSVRVHNELAENQEAAMRNRMEQFQMMMTTIVKNAIAENNPTLGHEIGEQVGDRVLKHMNYLMREQDEQEEERYRKLDEMIRNYQKNGRKERKAAKKEAKQMEKKAKLLSRNRKLNPNQA